MSGSDLLLMCSDCGQEFVFTAGEQQFFQERGYSSPRRCKPCRLAKQPGGISRLDKADSAAGSPQTVALCGTGQ